MAIYLVKSRRLKIALSTARADFGRNIFNNIQLPLKPMLALDLLLSRLTVTELANHHSSISAVHTLVRPDLARVQDMFGIEHLLDVLHQLEAGAVLLGDILLTAQTDTVLSRGRPADR